MNSTELNALITAAGAGHEVIIPDGTHSIDAPLFPLAGQALNFSQGAFLLKTADCSMIEVINHDVRIRRPKLNGSYYWFGDSGPLGNGIYAHGVHGLRIEDGYFTGIRDCAVVMTGILDAKVTGNTIGSCGQGNVYGPPSIFGNWDCADHVVTDNYITIHQGGPHAIAYHTEHQYSTIKRIRIANNRIINQGGGYCIEVGSFCSTGSDTERPTNVHIVDNQMSQSANCSGGISIEWIDETIVARNTYHSFGGSGTAGIECNNGRWVTIDTNTINGGGSVSIGIAFDHQGCYSRITNNTIKDILATSEGKYIAARTRANKVVGTAAIQHLLVQSNIIDAPAGADGDGIRIILEDDEQILEGVNILDNLIVWRGAGGSNSSGVVLGSLQNNQNMKNCVIRNNRMVCTHYGMYLQGFGPAAEPSRDLNKFVGCSVSEHWD